MSDPSLFKAIGTTWIFERVTGWPAIPRATIPRAGGGVVKVYDLRGLFPDEQSWTTTMKKTGFVFHHDAVAFSGKDVDFNGHTLDESLERIKVIYDYHRNLNNMRGPGLPSWNGVGYHALADLEGRIFLAGEIATHRAHVSNRNHDLYGICVLGNYSDGLRPDGSKVSPVDDRPPQDALVAMDSLCRFVTGVVGREMTLRPHKFYQEKPCPGDWATKESWAGFKYEVGDQPAPVTPPVDLSGVVGLIQRAQRDLKAIVEGDLQDAVLKVQGK